jgi:hypothetical protein
MERQMKYEKRNKFRKREKIKVIYVAERIAFIMIFYKVTT